MASDDDSGCGCGCGMLVLIVVVVWIGCTAIRLDRIERSVRPQVTEKSSGR